MATSPDAARRHRLLGWLLAYLLCGSLALNAVMLRLAPPGSNETVLQHTRHALAGRNLHDDSWGAMGEALDHLRSGDTTPVYTKVFFERGRKFQYPVSALLLFEPVRDRVDMISLLAFIATALAVAALLSRGLRSMGTVPLDSTTLIVGCGLAVTYTVTFYPVVKAVSLGQIQTWLNALFALALLCWSTDKKVAAGALVGLMTLIKPQMSVLLLWGLLRRHRPFVTGFLLVLALGLAGSLAQFGWRNHVDYLSVLSFLSQHGESFHPNQSFNGLLNRLAGLAQPEQYDNIRSDLHFPPYQWWVHAGTVVSSVVILVWALFWKARERSRDGTIDFSSAALACTVASPIAWEHHYGILLPIFVVLLFRVLGDHRRAIWLAIAYLLASNYLQVTHALATNWANVGQSYLLAAALIVLALLGSARRSVEKDDERHAIVA